MRSRIHIPAHLTATCLKRPDHAAWAARLPETLTQLGQEWSLTLGTPFDGDEASCSWVAPVELADGGPAVLKIGLPHMESKSEIAGLRFWDGDPTVRLLRADDETDAMLLERCQPGTALRAAAGPGPRHCAPAAPGVAAAGTVGRPARRLDAGLDDGARARYHPLS
jgi:streptomycin 6-kinase